MIDPKKQYTVRQATKEEVDAFNLDLQALQLKHELEMRAVPVLIPNNATGKFDMDAQVMVFKRVELVPKEDGAEQSTTEPAKEETA